MEVCPKYMRGLGSFKWKKARELLATWDQQFCPGGEGQDEAGASLWEGGKHIPGPEMTEGGSRAVAGTHFESEGPQRKGIPNGEENDAERWVINGTGI